MRSAVRNVVTTIRLIALFGVGSLLIAPVAAWATVIQALEGER